MLDLMMTESDGYRKLNSGRSGGTSEEDEEKIIDILDDTDVFLQMTLTL